jgi:hypothetical protein
VVKRQRKRRRQTESVYMYAYVWVSGLNSSSVCRPTYIYIILYIYIYIYTHAIWVYVCMCACIYVRIAINIHFDELTHACMTVTRYVCVRCRSHACHLPGKDVSHDIRTCIHTYVHTHTHTYIHTPFIHPCWATRSLRLSRVCKVNHKRVVHETDAYIRTRQNTYLLYVCRAWNVTTGECIKTFEGHRATVSAIVVKDPVVYTASV